MKHYVISDGNGLQAVILPEKGATCVSLSLHGREFLYCNDENLHSPERPRCGIPFLFPIFGRLKDSRYRWEGREYEMAIHGFGHTSAWQVAEETADSLTLVLDASAETLAQYPFRFRVSLRFTLENGGLTLAQKYENLDETPMPYNYGFHPYFATEKLENLRVETTAQTYFDFSKGPQPFGNGSITLAVPQGAPETGAVFTGVTGPTVLHNPSEGKKLTMEFDKSFHTHVLWTQAEKSFLCVEPVNGSADGLNTGVYLTLQPGEVREASVRFLPEIL